MTEKIAKKYGFDLILIKCMDGYSYEWQDRHGRVICCGWSRGSKKDGREEANNHLLEKFSKPPEIALAQFSNK